MITYYLDDSGSDVDHPRLVRRVNNGDPRTFDNTLGTAVAIDAVDLQFTYDISNGASNPGGVEMTDDDMGTTGACSPERLRGDADSEGEPAAARRASPNRNPDTPTSSTTPSSRRSACGRWRLSIGTDKESGLRFVQE